jgi:predicted chitinase
MRFNLNQPTLLKQFPVDSSLLAESQKTSLASGVLCHEAYTWGSHLVLFNDKKETLGYVFASHVKLDLPLTPYFHPEAKLTSIVKACQSMGITKVEQQAYVLATIHHETAGTMLPIKEFGGERQAVKLGYDGGANYFGRGFVQLTHRYNYLKFASILGLDLVSNPNLALNPSTSLYIAVYGMKNGTFTGKKLSDYITGGKLDYVNARRIINGNDKAQLIAKYAVDYADDIRNDFAKAKGVEKKLVDSYIGINPSRIKLLSQRDNHGDLNNDGRDDSVQTCNVHAVTMAVNALKKDTNYTVKELDAKVVKMPGSRYSHANLVTLMRGYNVTSEFSTSTPESKLLAHLETGNPAIWCNLLTHSGHIVVIAGYNKTTKKYLVYDSWGEPTNYKGKWIYQDIRKPYWLSQSAFRDSGMNGTNAVSHWLHLVSLIR